MTETPQYKPLRRTAMRGSSIAMLGFGLTQILNFAVYIALAALVSPREFGIFVAGSAVVGVASLFAESGFMAALIHRQDEIEEAANTALISTVLAGALLAVVAFASAPLVGWAFGDPHVSDVAAAMSGWLLVRSLTIVPDALLQRRFSFVRRVVVEPLGVVAFGATSLILCSGGSGRWGLVAAMYASIAVQAAAAWGFAGWRPHPTQASFRVWRELARFGRPVVASEVLRRIGSQADTLIIGRLVGIPALGQYRYGLRIANQPLLAWVSVGAYVLLPVFARISHEPDRIRTAFSHALKWMSAGALPLCFLLFPLGEPIAVVLFGERWRLAGEVMMALFLYPAGQAFLSLASEAYKGVGHPELLVKVHLFSLLASIALMLAGSPLGVIGVAAGVSVAAVAAGLVALRLASSMLGLGLKSLLMTLIVPVLSATGMAVATLGFDRLVALPMERGRVTGAVILGAEVVGALVIYVALLWLLDKRFVAETAAALRSMVRRGQAPQPLRGDVLDG